MAFKYVYRTSNQNINPTLAGAVYGNFITIGIPVGFKFNGSQTVAIIFICDGGNYGIDSLSSVEYKGSPITGADWILHRGTFTKQVTPKAVSSVDASTDFFTSTAHGFVNTDQIRFGIIDGNIPVPLSKDTKYFIVNKTTDTFQVSLTSGGSAVNITNIGTGSLICWKADAGFDDPLQGLPTFAPEANSTFNNIAYVEVKIPSGLSTVDVPPDWEDFRLVGIGRRLMNYDSTGAELGVVDTDIDMLSNGGLVILDNLITNYKIETSRIDFPSAIALKDSADVNIWQRAKAGVETVVSEGMTGRYFSDYNFTTQVLSRIDTTIDFVFTGISPVAGMPTTWYSIRWNGKIKPRYSELYTLTLNVDDVGILWVNGVKILDNTSGGGSTLTATYTMIADQEYDIQIDYKQITSTAYIHFKWQSASQALEVVPATRVLSSDIPVKRYPIHSAFPTATESSEIHERFMERCIGYDWTDDDGLIKFLPPDRGLSFAFVFDKNDDDSKANFAKGTFVKKRRSLSERKNFLLGKFRNLLLTGYPVHYVEADREALREFTNGQPDNDEPIDIGVSNRSQAERMLENDMVFKSDPRHTFSISSGRKSSKIRKNHIGTISYYDEQSNLVADETVIATFVSMGAKNSKRDFNLLPIPYPFYSDEPISGTIPDVDVTPTDLGAELI